MLSRPMKTRHTMWIVLFTAAAVSAAFAQEILEFTFQGEPGPPGQGADAEAYYTQEEVDEKIPAPLPWISSLKTELTYATPADVPDMSVYADDATFSGVTASWLDAAALDADYWREDELPNYAGYISNIELNGFAKASEIPSGDELLVADDVPDPDQFLTEQEWQDGYLQAADLAGIPTRNALDAAYLNRDEPIEGALQTQIQDTIEQELAEPTCPTDSVAAGSSCVDRFEASLWPVPCDEITDEVDAFNLTSASVLPADFQKSGTGPTPVYACSVADAPPARHMTWFQAVRACGEAGKRLCSNAEWQAAAIGTYAQDCHTSQTPALTGQAPDCESESGAMDMVGNVAEMTADLTHAGNTWKSVLDSVPVWFGSSGGFGNDLTEGVNSASKQGSGVPYSLIRGGASDGGSVAPGALALDVSLPTNVENATVGFRCCRRR